MPELEKNINTAVRNVPEYSVSEIAGAVKRTVEERFGYVRVRGEISGWRGPHSSGHAYFRLKDEGAVLEAVCWRGTMAKMPFKLEEGLEVIATGRITTYPNKSNYQIVIERMEPAGVGALMALLEQRKAKLAAEGLFEQARKRALPFLPRTIGVITSPTGAVIRDILHRIEDRFPVHVLVWPVAVQGEGAAEQVAEAIRGFNALPDTEMCPKPDVLIVARGGGSIEDLWAFNEEIVVRAAAASSIPLISAVGHETDTTLIDFVSDRRAPTPTAAAEMAVPVRDELLYVAQDFAARIQSGVLRGLMQRQQALEGVARGLPQPARLVDVAQQRLDDWSERLNASLPQLTRQKAQGLEALIARLRPQLLLKEVTDIQRKVSELSGRLNQQMPRLIQEKEHKLSALTQLLAVLDHTNVLKRGYALVRDTAGHVVSSATVAKARPELHITFADGELRVKP